MSTVDDLRWLEEMADTLLHGGLPGRVPLTTKTGEKLQAHIVALRNKWFAEWRTAMRLAGENEALRRELDAERSTNERLTAELERLQK